MTPWSVIPSAGISSCAARSTSLGMRLAPSSSEYSVWLCRWAKVLGACGIVWLLGVADPGDMLPAVVQGGPRWFETPGYLALSALVVLGVGAAAVEWITLTEMGP